MTRLLTTIAALSLGTALAAEPVQVVTGTAPAQGLTARVMQGIGTPTMILPVGGDPHSYAMRPSEARALGGAGLVVWIGEGHTPWLDGPIEELAGGAAVLELMTVEGLHTLSYGEGEHGHDDHKDDHAHGDHAHGEHGHDDHKDDHAHGDHAHGDHGEHAADHAHGEHKDDHAAEHAHGHDDHAGHGHDDHAGHGHDHHHSGVDTHAWLDPDNAVLWLNAIAEALAEQDPGNADAYRANAAAGAEEIKAAADDTRERLAALGDVHLVMAHDAWNYFAESFDVEIIGAIGDSHARAPSAARISELRALVADHEGVCVLTERTTSAGFVEALGASATARAEPNGMMGEIGPDFFPALLDEIVTGIEACFETA